MPAYLADHGMPAHVAVTALALIGLFNIIGTYATGWLGTRMPKRYILSTIYFSFPAGSPQSPGRSSPVVTTRTPGTAAHCRARSSASFRLAYCGFGLTTIRVTAVP